MRTSGCRSDSPGEGSRVKTCRPKELRLQARMSPPASCPKTRLRPTLRTLGRRERSGLPLRMPRKSRHTAKRGRKAAGTAPRSGPISLEAVDEYLRSCFVRETPPRVSELARALGVSRGSLIKTVKDLRGTTPAKYFRQKQVARAKQLLDRGWSIERVVREAGFGVKRSFFRSFHAETGITPTRYRIEQSVTRQRRRSRDRVFNDTR